jgi:flagellar hook-basal body complex protein FliE
MTDGMGIGKVGGMMGPVGGPAERATGPEQVQKSFGEMLAESIEKVEKLQEEAEVAMSRLEAGKSDPVREALAAAQKAEVAFKTLMQIRDGIMTAYQEINDMKF